MSKPGHGRPSLPIDASDPPMTATWPLAELLALLGRGTLTAAELATAPHELDATCTRATLETGEVYVWDNRRSLWIC
jgi:hypothetical protein